MVISKDNIRRYVTMPISLVKELEKLADEDNRSVNNLIVTILLRYVNENKKVKNENA